MFSLLRYLLLIDFNHSNLYGFKPFNNFNYVLLYKNSKDRRYSNDRKS